MDDRDKAGDKDSNPEIDDDEDDDDGFESMGSFVKPEEEEESVIPLAKMSIEQKMKSLKILAKDDHHDCATAEKMVDDVG